MKQKFFKLLLAALICIFGCTAFTSCSKDKKNENLSIAVFVPGVLEGNPTYEMMDEDQKNQVMGYLMALKKTRKITEAEYKKETIKLWKK